MDNLAYPPCNYSWSHDGVTLPATMHDDYNTTGLSILNISNVRIQDFGNYTLTMMNSVGTYVTAYQLLPGGNYYCILLLLLLLLYITLYYMAVKRSNAQSLLVKYRRIYIL